MKEPERIGNINLKLPWGQGDLHRISRIAAEKALEGLLRCSYKQIETKIELSEEAAEQMESRIRDCKIYIMYEVEIRDILPEPEKQKFRKVIYIKKQYEHKLKEFPCANTASLPF